MDLSRVVHFDFVQAFPIFAGWEWGLLSSYLCKVEIFNPFCFGRKKDACVPDNLENADLTIAFYIYNCIYLFGHAGSSLLCGLSSSCDERELPGRCGVPASHSGDLRSMAVEWAGLSRCGLWEQLLWSSGSRAQAQYLWCPGLVAPLHVGSSWIRDPTHVSYIGR